MNYIADEFGFRVESPNLPTPPPPPAHALEQIAHAERERAAGIVHDGQYDPIRYGEHFGQEGFGGGVHDPRLLGQPGRGGPRFG